MELTLPKKNDGTLHTEKDIVLLKIYMELGDEMRYLLEQSVAIEMDILHIHCQKRPRCDKYNIPPAIKPIYNALFKIDFNNWIGGKHTEYGNHIWSILDDAICSDFREYSHICINGEPSNLLFVVGLSNHYNTEYDIIHLDAGETMTLGDFSFINVIIDRFNKWVDEVLEIYKTSNKIYNPSKNKYTKNCVKKYKKLLGDVKEIADKEIERLLGE